jgi:hypothetical protein
MYTKKALQDHYARGDADQQTKGHPLCEFCNQNFYSSDQLYEHLERQHETCHLCEKDGIRFQYFKDYNYLVRNWIVKVIGDSIAIL